MGQPNFWDNPEKAQQVIQQLKPLNGLLKPYEELAAVADDMKTLAELADEDEGLERELEAELGPFEQRLAEFEMRSMLDGPQDASNAFLRVQAGTGGTEACDWAQMLLRLYARWAERHGYQAELVDELRRDTFRSGGPGGQHQNKTESGVRYTHLPTGIAAESRTERSQHKNDANAMALLKAKLYRIEEQKRRAEVEKLYDEKGEVAWGYQIRNYVMQPYTLVKDVRTGVETSQVDSVLDGEIDDFIQAYLRHKTEQRHKKKK